MPPPQVRLAKSVAAYQLEHTDKPVVDIAGEHGYDSSSKFASAFRSVKGAFPETYRKRLAGIAALSSRRSCLDLCIVRCAFDFPLFFAPRERARLRVFGYPAPGGPSSPGCFRNASGHGLRAFGRKKALEPCDSRVGSLQKLHPVPLQERCHFTLGNWGSRTDFCRATLWSLP